MVKLSQDFIGYRLYGGALQTAGTQEEGFGEVKEHLVPRDLLQDKSTHSLAFDDREGEAAYDE